MNVIRLSFIITLVVIPMLLIHGQHISAVGDIALVIHGGAGTIEKGSMTPEKEKAIREKLAEALTSGYAVLDSGGAGLDAVVTAITILEDSPLFNAGKGAVFTNEGRNELDASIMEGKLRNAGAVAGVTTVKNPILAARAVMEHSPHVLMAREGAEQFAQSLGIETVSPDYFYTEDRFQSLLRAKEQEENQAADEKKGTVGCVALDREGNLVAGTSTGGMTNKRYGRVGDSPIIGAGTYADNATCGISSTGHGEYFIRSVVAYDIAARMGYKEESLREASEAVVMQKLVEFGGSGGIIGMDAEGNISMVFNTAGMYRGYIQEAGIPRVFIYQKD